jgi:hypothetical protein
MLVAQRGIQRTCDRKKIVKQTRRYSSLFEFIQLIYLAGAATPGVLPRLNSEVAEVVP